MKKSIWLMVVPLTIGLVGCSSVPEKGTKVTHAPGVTHVPGVTHAPGAMVNLENTSLVKKVLYEQYNQWKHTRYRMGGMSRSGVDCSGFIQVTFKTKLGVVLPRSTEFQAQLGESVSKSELRAGDLVFFKTRWSGRHVGVYIEDGRFLHASSTYGVTISKLNESYWKSAYWKAKRLDM
ncbi:NlpC/P60 family protein [Nitrosospira multiformis]|jgi:cell wall-associated NlpC family hydrolase|nr:NlpC/P60 family protein [Nitrosospira multiformis]